MGVGGNGSEFHFRTHDQRVEDFISGAQQHAVACGGGYYLLRDPTHNKLLLGEGEQEIFLQPKDRPWLIIDGIGNCDRPPYNVQNCRLFFLDFNQNICCR